MRFARTELGNVARDLKNIRHMFANKGTAKEKLLE
jgi:hypothetical protein